MALPADGHAQADGELGQRPDGRDADGHEDPGQQHDHLDGGHEPEAERVADDDLAARHRGGHEPLQRAAGALAQEAHAGQQVDEEVGEEAHDGRCEAGDGVLAGHAVDGQVADRRQAAVP